MQGGGVRDHPAAFIKKAGLIGGAGNMLHAILDSDLGICNMLHQDGWSEA
jgi:hypothetical protein